MDSTDPVRLMRELERFDASLPIERAWTPPASWYLEPGFLERERTSVFRRTWQAVGRMDQVRERSDYFTGCLLGEPYLVLRDAQGTLRGFHNVCRHHAAQVCAGEGKLEELECPYHGWTYALDGTLTRAPRLGKSEIFEREKFSLRPVAVEAWGPFVFLHLGEHPSSLRAQLGDLEARLERMRWRDLRFAARRTYEMQCNWKVYVDNYLDGGYHVSYLHRALAGQLDLKSYRTELFDRLSIQSCKAPDEKPAESGGDFAERIGEEALYAFFYPNFMINRYGPILDTNWVVPLSHDRTRVVFDFFFRDTEGSEAREFIERSVAASHRVQEEDVTISESVQRGLTSPAYDRGIYAPSIEMAAYHFHRLLARDLRKDAPSSAR
jgi:phenylpropionate dioxygenase-like ring-hydroxylating dioxygenase large terminal subunit